MGRINIIWNPIYWKVFFEGKNRMADDDIIYKMVIGFGEDYESYEIIEFISKENYENIINGKYSIKVFPYSEIPILLFNEYHELIPLIRGMNIDFQKLNQEQKEYAVNLNKEKIKVKGVKK